jgi:cell division protein FtsW (lipid II flippase)
MFLFSMLAALTAAVAQQEHREPPRFWRNLLIIALPLVGLYLILIAYQQLAIASLVLVIMTLGLSVWLYRQQMLTGYSAWLWLGFIGLAGIGLLVQIQLAVGADNSSWYRYARLQAISLAVILWGIALLAVFPKAAFAKRWEVAIIRRNHFRPWLIITPVSLVFLSLLWLKLSGSEGGVSGFQPAEFAKLVLVILIAIALTAWTDLQHSFWQTQQNLSQYKTHHWWQSPRLWIGLRLGIWVSLVVVLAILVLGSVRDFSPLLILLLLMFGYLWAIRRKLPKALQLLILILPIMFILALWMLWHYPQWFASLLSNFQGERLLVWVNPWLDPDMGLQAQRSLSAIHQAGWLETQWFGANGELMSIPAVQNDFILAFVLAHTGALGGFFLLALQLSWLGLLFGLAQRLRHSPKQAQEQWLALQFLAWLIYGLAWLQITHWLISWCNVLGLLPIMGQPMTWLSSGNSHLLALGLPTVLLALMATWLMPNET